MNKKRAEVIYNLLNDYIKEPKTELNYSTTFELLVAVVLSAQCTDKRVNVVTEKLFKLYNTPYDFAKLEQQELEKLIFSTGFYRNKAKNIILASKEIVNKHNGQVPSNYDDLVRLPGVGRKTANVIVSVAFDEPAIAVDTHVFRVSNRLGLTKAKNVLETEKQLQKLFSKDKWARLHHLLVLYGRYTCTAKNPKCHLTPLKDYCNHDKKDFSKGKK